MGTVVIKCTTTEIAKMQTYYQKYLTNTNVPYTTFTAKTPLAAINAYTSGKVMFQGNQAEQEAALWQGKKQQTQEKNKKQNEIRLPADFSKKSIIGSDEVGNGSYFGPVVVAAVYAANDQLQALQQLGVKDSKMLTDQQIRALAPKIMTLVPHQVLVVSPTKYNEIQPRYNAVHMKVVLHQQALTLLSQKILPIKADAILIDQFTPETSFKKYLKQNNQTMLPNVYFKTKGEQYHLAVAAASILCRAQFLESLDQASKETGMLIPSGAGVKSDQVAASLIEKGGLDLLGKYAKLHFANTQKALKLSK